MTSAVIEFFTGVFIFVGAMKVGLYDNDLWYIWFPMIILSALISCKPCFYIIERGLGLYKLYEDPDDFKNEYKRFVKEDEEEGGIF